MSELHNIQVMLTQIPRAQKLAEHAGHLIPNGNQILNLTQQKENDKKLTKVQEFEELAKTEKEDPEKRRIKKDADQKGGSLDIYG